MSHTVVQSITFEDGSVFWRADANNVSPRDYGKRRCEYFSQMLTEYGRVATELAILRGYEDGGLQGKANRFTRALDRLYRIPEYAQFDWRQDIPYYRDGKYTEERKALDELRRSEAFTQLLRRAMYKIFLDNNID